MTIKRFAIATSGWLQNVSGKRKDHQRMRHFSLKYLITTFLILTFYGCVPLPNFDTEWIYPEIKGSVVDSLTNQPLKNILVISDRGDSTYTDNEGRFNFKADKEFIGIHWITMDPPRPHLSFTLKNEFSTKEIDTLYVKNNYNREKPDTLTFDKIKLTQNASR